MRLLLKDAFFNSQERDSFENFGLFRLKVECLPTSISADAIRGFFERVKDGDSGAVHISHCDELIMTIRLPSEVDRHMLELSEEIREASNDSPFSLSFEIEKGKRKKVYIYDFSLFLDFWGQHDYGDLLELLSDFKRQFSGVFLETIEHGIESFQSPVISLNQELSTFKPGPESWLGENCHFEMASKIGLSPDDLDVSEGEGVPLCSKLLRLKAALSLIYLADISTLGPEKVQVKIYGYRVLSFSVKYAQLDEEKRSAFFRLYEWCYSDHARLSDKLGITRNILSIHLKDGLERLSGDIVNSVYSSHRTYLKENLNKYLELRNTLLEELNWVSQKAGDISEAFVSTYYKSLISFLTFFASIFVVRIVSGSEYGQAFDGEAATMAFAFLAVSLIILVVLRINVRLEIKRLKRKYEHAKNRYLDLLDERDIAKIVRDNEEFDYEIGHIRSRQCIYTWLWVLSVALLAYAVYACSSFELSF